MCKLQPIAANHGLRRLRMHQNNPQCRSNHPYYQKSGRKRNTKENYH
ncbi:hypothetical protein Ocin01_15545 [Orchesella cincta]|uniref:Uncharacterized protein n=1 Tax=Orchesella cincta TaxID=48709 RepID=A0A1D2MDP2_ORCCI|nr:hypothetical protein Ocin01_15545 [Orchesella cincta]